MIQSLSSKELPIFIISNTLFKKHPKLSFIHALYTRIQLQNSTSTKTPYPFIIIQKQSSVYIVNKPGTAQVGAISKAQK